MRDKVMNVSHVDSGPALLVKKLKHPRTHWSRSVFAHDLRRSGKSDATLSARHY